jgi:hypothetical protein
MAKYPYDERKTATIKREANRQTRIRLDECVKDLPISVEHRKHVRMLIADALSIGYDNGYDDAQRVMIYAAHNLKSIKARGEE